jgi:outer membrane protein assembly factor BamB
MANLSFAGCAAHDTIRPMHKRRILLALALAHLLLQAALGEWSQWRGPLGTGESPDGDPPIHWSATENIRWKQAIPGLGHSTPVIAGEHIFITTAVPYGERFDAKKDTAPGAHDNFPVTSAHAFMVIAYNRQDGKKRWEHTVTRERPREGGHFTGSLASNSPVTDGTFVYAYFGSRGLFCLDMKGEVVWEKDWGDMNTRHAHGEGSSPALHGNTLVINWDHEDASFITAIDKRTGQQRWKKERDEMTSWSSPLIVEHAGRHQVILPATGKSRAYDLETGEVVWECSGLSRNVVSTPVAGKGRVFLSNSYDWQAIQAITLEGARGDITKTKNLAWSHRQNTSYVPSPLLYKDTLYFLSHLANILTGIDVRSGEVIVAPFRLEGINRVFASPVAAAGRVYLCDLDGTTHVFKHGTPPRTLAVNQLDDRFSASPVIEGKALYLRGKHLYCIMEEDK